MSGKRPQLLLIDNFDSFTYILLHYFEALGCRVDVIRNDTAPPTLIYNNYQGVVISPGPGTPAQSGNLMGLLNLLADKVPVLGICLGMQAIGEHYGLILKHGSKPFHGKQTEITHTDHPMFANVPNKFLAGRYHSLALKSTNTAPFETTAISAEGETMAMAHKHLPLWGIQFHPESCMTEHGTQMIKNWCGLLKAHVARPKA